MRPHRSGDILCSASTEPRLGLEESIAAEGCIVYSRSSCPYCLQAKEQLDALGARYRVVELDAERDGATIRAGLSELTGRTSVPAVFVGGDFVGGANDGGLGGVLTLQREGRLAPLLVDAGALPPDYAPAAASDPIALLFGRLLFRGGDGKRIAWGVLQQDVDPSAVPSEAERARRREQAATALTNIDAAERERRKLAGTAFSALTAVLAAGLLAAHTAPLARAAIAPPLFLSYGFLASARSGLWNIGQGGVWDVDGSGLQAIDDPSLASQLRAKVNTFNLQSAAIVGLATLAFVVAPELF